MGCGTHFSPARLSSARRAAHSSAITVADMAGPDCQPTFPHTRQMTCGPIRLSLVSVCADYALRIR
jgi:hypothetical protein